MDEYISREKAIETIQYRVCQGHGNKEHICERGSCAYCGIMEVMNDISSIADAQPVNQWVSTKDRLPEESDEYLAVVDGVIMEVGYTPKQKGLICVWSTCDADGFKPLADNAVTHWMPLPEPPQD